MHVRRDMCDTLVRGRLLRVRLEPLLGWVANPCQTTQATGHSKYLIT
jgi:hypothetical protein